MKVSKDLWLGLLCLLISAVGAVMVHDLSAGGVKTELGPAFFPWLMVGGIAFFSVLLLVRAVLLGGSKDAQGDADSGFSLKLLGKLAFFVVFMLIYAAVYVEVGFLISTAVFFIVAMLVLGERRIVHVAVIPVCVIVSVYLIFTKIMQVYIP